MRPFVIHSNYVSNMLVTIDVLVVFAGMLVRIPNLKWLSIFICSPLVEYDDTSLRALTEVGNALKDPVGQPDINVSSKQFLNI